MNKNIKSFLIKVVVMFFITQALIPFIDIRIFKSFTNWMFCNIYGIAIGLTMSYGHDLKGKYIEKRLAWLQSPIKSAIISFVTGTLLTISLMSLINVVLFFIMHIPLNQFMQHNWYSIKIAFIMYISIAFVAHAAAFYVKWKNLAIEQEKQKTESLKLRFEALRNHVNPHFLFNSLSTLTHLIEVDKDKAIDFTNHLSETYRYIIDTKEKELVSLDEEMLFVDSYLRLQNIRYGQLVEVHNRIKKNDIYQVIPVSVQMLIENVFKHTIISKDSKVTIELWIENDFLYVKNNINAKNNNDDRIPTGLANIRARYEYLTNRECVFGKQDNYFVVALPLLMRD
jgi:sensor histidine kinase YesM